MGEEVWRSKADSFVFVAEQKQETEKKWLVSGTHSKDSDGVDTFQLSHPIFCSF